MNCEEEEEEDVQKRSAVKAIPTRDIRVKTRVDLRFPVESMTSEEGRRARRNRWKEEESKL